MNIVQAEVSESIQKSQVIYYAIKLIVLNKLDIEVNEASNKQKVKWKGINNHRQHDVFWTLWCNVMFPNIKMGITPEISFPANEPLKTFF